MLINELEPFHKKTKKKTKKVVDKVRVLSYTSGHRSGGSC